jgi:LacI family transcriptional regulator
MSIQCYVGIVSGIFFAGFSSHAGFKETFMRSKQSVVTIQDVARAAGVSITTASRVLNNKDDVAPETYEKVRRVMQELNYTPSLAAKGMRSRTSKVIGLILPEVTEPFDLEIIKGAGAAIRDSEYDMIIYTSGGPPLSRRASWELEQLALLSAGLTDGCIVVTPSAPPQLIFAPNRSLN